MAFDLQPVLRGELLELRPLSREDFEALYAAASDPLIWEQHPESTRYKREVFQNFFDSALASGGAFAVIDRATGSVIGSSRYCNMTADEKEVEIGWTFLVRKFWGGEYNREMKRLMLDHALPHVERVVFVVGENNMRSQKALEKIGAKLLRRKERMGPGSNEGAKVVFVIEAHSEAFARAVHSDTEKCKEQL